MQNYLNQKKEILVQYTTEIKAVDTKKQGEQPLSFDMDDILAELDKEKQALRISVDKRKYGKMVTLLSGFGLANKSQLKELAKKLKKTLGCGGTVTEVGSEITIELQGDWRNDLPEILEKEGYNAEEITIRK